MFWLLMLSIVSRFELRLNGFLPDNNIHKMTPQLHTSHFSEYSPYNTSGAM